VASRFGFSSAGVGGGASGAEGDFFSDRRTIWPGTLLNNDRIDCDGVRWERYRAHSRGGGIGSDADCSAARDVGSDRVAQTGQ